MRKKMYRMFCLAVLSLTTGALAEVIQSTGFEDGGTNPSGYWTPYVDSAGSSYEYITDGSAGDDVYTGTRAVSITNPSDAGDRWTVSNSGRWSVDAGQAYELMVWVKTENVIGVNVYAEMVWYDESGGEVGDRSSTEIINSDSGWTQLSVFGVSPTNAALFRPLLWAAGASGSSGTVTYDDVELATSPIVESTGFEDGSAGWNGYVDSVGATKDYITDGTAGDDVHSGSRAISISDPADANERWTVLNAYRWAVETNQAYELTLWVKTENLTNVGAYAEMVWYDESGVEVGDRSSADIVDSDSDWVQLSAYGVSPENAVLFRPILIAAGASGSSGTVTYDDVELSITEVIEDPVVETSGFEEGINNPTGGWLPYVNSVGVTTEYITDGTAGDDVHSGSRAVSITDPADDDERWTIMNAYRWAVETNQAYELSVWVKTENITNVDAYVEMIWYDESGTEVGTRYTSDAVDSDSDWTQLTVSGLSPTNAALFRPILFAAGAEGSSGTVTFDDLEFATTELPEPEPVLVDAFGMSMSSANVILGWIGSSTASYAVQRKLDLIAGSWSNVAAGIVGVDGTLYVTNSMDEDQAFFRIVVE